MSERHDDVAGLIAEAQAATEGRRTTKVRQRWTGDVAARTRPGEGHALGLELQGKSPKSWDHAIVAAGDNWVSVGTCYVAKGANADDAEKLVRRAADKIGVTIDAVAVDTHAITVLGDD